MELLAHVVDRAVTAGRAARFVGRLITDPGLRGPSKLRALRDALQMSLGGEVVRELPRRRE